jgi:hypothetical protein
MSDTSDHTRSRLKYERPLLYRFPNDMGERERCMELPVGKHAEDEYV